MDKVAIRAHRLSHLRSCAVLVAQKCNVPRSRILAEIEISEDYDGKEFPSDEMIEKAIVILDRMRDA